LDLLQLRKPVAVRRNLRRLRPEVRALRPVQAVLPVLHQPVLLPAAQQVQAAPAPRLSVPSTRQVPVLPVLAVLPVLWVLLDPVVLLVLAVLTDPADLKAPAVH
jgi:hypothetical protein